MRGTEIECQTNPACVSSPICHAGGRSQSTATMYMPPYYDTGDDTARRLTDAEDRDAALDTYGACCQDFRF